MTNKAPYIKTWIDLDSPCGNFFRVLWRDGTETGYPTPQIRMDAISTLT